MTKKFLGIASIATLLLSSNGMAASFDVKGEQISNECALTVMKKQVQVDRYLQIAAQYDTLEEGLKKKIDAANDKLLKSCSKDALAAKAAEKAQADKERQERNKKLLAEQRHMFDNTWVGSYSCDGMNHTNSHNITIEMTGVNKAKAEFTFKTPLARWGLYEMKGKASGNTLIMTATKWIDKPAAFRAISWELYVDGNRMRGVGSTHVSGTKCELDARAHYKAKPIE